MQRPLFKHFHPARFVCGMRGHVTPAAHVATLDPVADAGVGVDLPDGRRLSRCLRCDGWQHYPQDPNPKYQSMPEWKELQPLPRRDAALKEALIMRVIAIDKALHFVFFAMLAIGLFFVQHKIGGFQKAAQDLIDGAQSTGHDKDNAVQSALHKLVGVHKSTLTTLTLGATGYAIIEGVEAVGLWLEKRWAEYLTVLATAGLLPLEIHELLDRVTFLRIFALVVNLAIVIYLIYSKRLFGLRGGYTPHVGAPPEETFAPPTAAAKQPAPAPA